MTGAIASNLHEGSRSEILADYLFSTFGTVTPVRRQDDFGIDLYCTLNDKIGQRAVVGNYYSVQVKSSCDPWVFKSREDIRWLIEYPTPLFLACVDKKRGVLSVYHTMPRFLAAFWQEGNYLELTPSSDEEGGAARWDNGTRFSLSAPIIRIEVNDLLDGEKLDSCRRVLQYWVSVDRDNCTLRRMGLLRFRMPQSYRVNEVPASSIAELGNIRPTLEQMNAAILNMVEVLDCAGHQLLETQDRKGALYAGLLLHYLRVSRGSLFTDYSRGRREDQPFFPFERTVSAAVNGPSAYVLAGLEEAARQVEEVAAFARFADNSKAESE